MRSGYNLIELTAGGGTSSIPIRNPYSHSMILGNATMTSGWTVQITGTPQKGHREILLYRATMNFNGNTLTIFGKSIPSYLQSKPFNVEAVYDGSAWQVNVMPSTIETLTVDGSSIVAASIDGSTKLTDDSVVFTKLEPLAEGEILIGDSSDDASAVFAGGNAKILIGDGTTLNSVAVSGDVAISNAGVVSIQPGVITSDMLAFEFLGQVKAIALELDQADVLALNGTPIEILSAPDPNVAYVPCGLLINYTYNSAIFNWSGEMQIKYAGGGLIVEAAEADVETGANKIWSIPFVTQFDITKGVGIEVSAETANPTGGGTSSKYYLVLYYYEITLT